jgi:acetolactate synthase-1/2/3 large subunit
MSQAENTKIGAQILVDELSDMGVTHVFGYPGGANLPIYDVINKTKMTVVLNGDERCAGHAAAGYARATGKPGVALVTSGPGATNLVTPLADAKMDSTPMIGISGQVKSNLIGKDAFQETPITTVTMQVTKHNYLVTHAQDIARVTREAFHIATTGRPGPVHIDFSKDAQEERIPVTSIDRAFRLPGYKPDNQTPLDMAAIDQVAALIAKAKRPIIYAGHGVLLGEAWLELKELAEKGRIPVVLTILGLTAFPASHELYAGMLGMHGSAHANMAVDEADLVLALGARFDDRVTGNVREFLKNATIVHIDIDSAEINKNKRVHVGIVSALKPALKALNSRLKAADSAAWVKHVQELKQKYPLVVPVAADGHIKPQAFVRRLSQLVKGRRTIFCTGVGQHQMWSCQYLELDEPRTLITSAGLGTMGFGLPAAVGAQCACPDSLVIDIDGDGSFEMNLNEMRTVQDLNLPIKVVILNNKILGMVGQWQRKFYNRNYSSVEFNEYPNYTKGIKALYGIETAAIDKADQVDKAIETMLKHDGPYLLEVRIPKEEDVYPMIPAGGTVKDMILG